MVNRDTLSVIVRKTEGGAPGDEMPEGEDGTPGAGAVRGAGKPSRRPAPEKVDVSGLIASRRYIDEEVNRLVDRLHGEGKALAIWGASHQGFTLAATTRLGDKVSYIIDSAPFKQGRFAPTSHLPIVAPAHFAEEPVDAILIVAPGYTEEIAGIIREKFGNSVEILALKTDHLETL